VEAEKAAAAAAKAAAAEVGDVDESAFDGGESEEEVRESARVGVPHRWGVDVEWVTGQGQGCSKERQGIHSPSMAAAGHPAAGGRDQAPKGSRSVRHVWSAQRLGCHVSFGVYQKATLSPKEAGESG
jgi:hypothetical protein